MHSYRHVYPTPYLVYSFNTLLKESTDAFRDPKTKMHFLPSGCMNFDYGNSAEDPAFYMYISMSVRLPPESLSAYLSICMSI
jgi:hypothetical protein